MKKTSVFSRFTLPAYTLMRFFFGALFACHGAQKLFGVLGKKAASEPLMWLAGGIEFVGGLLIAIGFFTPIAAFFCAGQMAVAYIQVHAPNSVWPIVNGGELALLYLFGFLYIMTRGSGRWSVDALVGRPA